ncbi:MULTISPECIES: branched-chain amino acid ABC transporter ATP-binding protein/permease [unclassified Nocardioides]|uniref:branched-chain amino acid ABC transporter ATP-binding protein/permease n=1 Tax=unclassified Nocardioides TaxID=2615069 RepID=UPI000056F74E|nr:MULTISPECIES: branched-chain amino acid ABC transporter ATP-binding protein/permease [unclassified Nocardioides]ABL83938.1 amino acid/amide ABC transporter membrane protein 2, HAAT family / amino acid/amide ABC transporter ATP-binding protein 1, HAAT family [Nocardioides sp. JS614]
MKPIWLGRAVALAAGVLLVAYPMLSDDIYYQNMIILSLIFAVGASGLNIISGFAGYISLGQGAFLGLGGYTIGVLAGRYPDASPWLWVPLGGIVAAGVALILGFVSLRSRGPAFVIITVAFLFLVQVIAVNWVSLTNGTTGLTLPLPTWDRDIMNWPFYYVLVAILALQLLMTWWIRRTKLGMGLIAIREDETKAATIGINLPVQKIIAFMASALFVGMAGAVYGYYLTFIDPRGMFSILISVQLVLSMLIGGKATLWGPVIGAFLVEWLNEMANNDWGGGNTRLFLFGGLLMAVVIFLPKGIIPAIESALSWRRTRGKAGLVGARIGTGGSLASITDRVHLVDRSKIPDRALLEVKNLKRHFGGVKAVDGASFAVPEGSITGLIGPNGSGKTTLFNLIDDTIRAESGEIWLEGRRIDGMRSWQRAHLGLGRTFQITRLFREMTVLENVVAVQRRFSIAQLGRIAVSGAEAKAAEELLEFVGMRAFRDQKAQALSYGQQKLVELAQILMLDPKLILLDEPAGGINPVLIERMGEMIRELNSYGKTFLIVEHNMPFVLGLCDPIHVLARGRTMASGTPEEIQRDPAVIDAYLGDDFVLEEKVAP